MMHKTYFAVLGAALAAVACGEENPPPKTPETTAVSAQPPTPPAPPVVETVAPPPAKPTLAELIQKNTETFMAGMKAHDSKMVASTYSENAVIKMAGAPDMSGREALAAMMQKQFDAFSDSKGGASRVFVKGDVVIAEWQMTGKHTGDFYGIKATGKDIGYSGVSVTWYNEEGLRKEEHMYMDVGTIMAQVGAPGAPKKFRAIPSIAMKPDMFASTGAETEGKNADLVKTMFGAFEKKSAADFTANITDTTEWDDMSQPMASKGKTDAKKYYDMMSKSFPDAKIEVKNAWGFGDWVVAETVTTGTQKADFMGIKASKKPINLHSVDLVQVKDGKIIHGYSYGNTAEMMMQLGAMKDPTAPAAAKPAAAPAKPAAAPAKPAAAPAKPAPKK